MIFKAREDNAEICYLGGCDVSLVDGMSFVPGEIIQIGLRDPISAIQFGSDCATNGDQIDFIRNQ